MSDQRKHKRLKTPEETFVRADGCLGRMIDISKGGLSLMLLIDLNLNKELPKEMSLDIISHDNLLKARKIQGKIAWQENVHFPHIYGVYMKFGVQFHKLTTKQQGQIGNFLLSYTH